MATKVGRPALVKKSGRPATERHLDLIGQGTEGLAFGLLLFTLIFAPLAQGSLYPWSLFGFRAFVALTLALTGVAAALRGSLSLPPVGALVPLGIFLSLYALSSSLSPNAFGSKQALINTLCQVSGFFLVVSLVRTPRRRSAFLASLLVGALMMGSYGALQVLGHGFTPTMYETLPPISGFYYNRIHYAGFLDLVSLGALGLALFIRVWWVRLLSGLLALLLYLNLGMTFSDAGWAATGLATLGLLVFWTSRVRGRAMWGRFATLGLLVLLGVAGLGAFLYHAPGLSGTFREKLETLRGVTPEGEPTTAGLGNFYSRLYIYDATLKIVRERPLLGVGPGNFIYALPEWRPPNALDFRSGQLHKFVNYAHNDYLQIASEAGIPATIFFVAFWLMVLRFARRAPLPLTGLTFGLVALLLHGLVDGNLTINHASAFLAYAAAGVLVSGVGSQSQLSTKA